MQNLPLPYPHLGRSGSLTFDILTPPGDFRYSMHTTFNNPMEDNVEYDLHIIEATRRVKSGARLPANCGEVIKKVSYPPRTLNIKPTDKRICPTCRKVAADSEVKRPKGSKPFVVYLNGPPAGSLAKLSKDLGIPPDMQSVFFG